MTPRWARARAISMPHSSRDMTTPIIRPRRFSPLRTAGCFSCRDAKPSSKRFPMSRTCSRKPGSVIWSSIAREVTQPNSEPPVEERWAKALSSQKDWRGVGEVEGEAGGGGAGLHDGGGDLVRTGPFQRFVVAEGDAAEAGREGPEFGAELVGGGQGNAGGAGVAHL